MGFIAINPSYGVRALLARFAIVSGGPDRVSLATSRVTTGELYER